MRRFLGTAIAALALITGVSAQSYPVRPVTMIVPFPPGGLTDAGLAVTGSVGLQAQARQRSMYVSVLDEAGRPVLDVSPSDLAIREDGVPREILRLVPADEPAHVFRLESDR